MKSPHPSRLNPAFFQQDLGEQPVRLIKAAQASKLFSSATTGHTHSSNHNGSEPHKKPEIRMIHAGADYCDLEVICGCGESTQVRCWNSPQAS